MTVRTPFQYTKIFMDLAAGLGAKVLGGVDTTAREAGLLTTAQPTQIAGNIINVILGLSGIILVIILVYAGILYLTSQGGEEKIKEAKTLIKRAVIGIVIIAAAYAISIFIVSQLSQAFAGFFEPTPAYASVDPLKDLNTAASNAGFGTVAENTPSSVIARFINAILGLVGILFLVILVYGGVLYLTSGGQEEKIKQAKKMLVSAIIGTVIIVISYALTSFVFGQIAKFTV